MMNQFALSQQPLADGTYHLQPPPQFDAQQPGEGEGQAAETAAANAAERGDANAQPTAVAATPPAQAPPAAVPQAAAAAAAPTPPVVRQTLVEASVSKPAASQDNTFSRLWNYLWASRRKIVFTIFGASAVVCLISVGVVSGRQQKHTAIAKRGYKAEAASIERDRSDPMRLCYVLCSQPVAISALTGQAVKLAECGSASWLPCSVTHAAGAVAAISGALGLVDIGLNMAQLQETAKELKESADESKSIAAQANGRATNAEASATEARGRATAAETSAAAADQRAVGAEASATTAIGRAEAAETSAAAANTLADKAKASAAAANKRAKAAEASAAESRAALKRMEEAAAAQQAEVAEFKKEMRLREQRAEGPTASAAAAAPPQQPDVAALLEEMRWMREERAREAKLAAENELRQQTRMAQLELISEGLARRQLAPLQQDPLATLLQSSPLGRLADPGRVNASGDTCTMSPVGTLGVAGAT
jgi:hypothetical protein